METWHETTSSRAESQGGSKTSKVQPMGVIWGAEKSQQAFYVLLKKYKSWHFGENLQRQILRAFLIYHLPHSLNWGSKKLWFTVDLTVRCKCKTWSQKSFNAKSMFFYSILPLFQEYPHIPNLSTWQTFSVFKSHPNMMFPTAPGPSSFLKVSIVLCRYF